jgi:hypothetical protein
MLDFIRSLLVKAGFGKDSIERIENLETKKPAKKQAKKPAAKKETVPKPVAVSAPAPKPATKKDRKKVSYSVGTPAKPNVKIPKLKYMNKQKIIDFGKQHGLELTMKMTKKELIKEVTSKLS